MTSPGWPPAPVTSWSEPVRCSVGVNLRLGWRAVSREENFRRVGIAWNFPTAPLNCEPSLDSGEIGVSATDACHYQKDAAFRSPAPERRSPRNRKIAGGPDTPVIGMNQEAMEQMPNVRVELEIVPGATNLFEGRGAREKVAELARDWFVRYLPRGAAPAHPA